MWYGITPTQEEYRTLGAPSCVRLVPGQHIEVFVQTLAGEWHVCYHHGVLESYMTQPSLHSNLCDCRALDGVWRPSGTASCEPAGQSPPRPAAAFCVAPGCACLHLSCFLLELVVA